MFNINQDFLRQLGIPNITCSKGKTYFAQGRVKSVRYDTVNNQFFGKVVGEQEYNVSIDFDDEYEFVDAKCSCPAYKGYKSYCKHIVAMLLNISKNSKTNKDKDNRKSKIDQIKEKQSFEGMETLLAYYQLNAVNNVDTIQIEMEVTCMIKRQYFEPDRGKGQVSFSFKLGENKLYRVKDVKELIRSIEERHPLVFGKLFTFNPSLHHFKEEDLVIINYLRELYDYENKMMEDVYGDINGFFKGKEIYPPPLGIKKLLTLLKGRSLQVELEGSSPDYLPIVEGSLPLKVLLVEEEGGLQLQLREENIFKTLEPSGTFYFTKDKILMISPEEQREIVPIIKATEKTKSKRIPIPKELQETFFTGVLPNMMKTGKLQIAPKVKDLMEDSPLIAKIYIDTVGSQVLAKLHFNYGDIEINPFKGEGKNKKHNKIILRQIDEEEKVLKFFEDLEFKVKDAHIYLEDDNQIYRLVVEKLNELQEIAEVYISEAFNKIKVKEQLSWVGGIRLREDDLLEFSFEIEGISNREIVDILVALEEKKKYYRLKDGSLLQLDLLQLGQFRDIIRQLSLKDEDLERGNIIIPKYRGMVLEELIDQNHLIKKDESFERYIHFIKNPEAYNFIIPETTGKLMRGYQKKGFHWIKTFKALGLGGILADDMGLGKTLQMISAILADKEEGVQGPSLVVVPSSLLRNWYEEVEKFAPQLKTLVIFGTPKEREELIHSIKDYDLVITSYPLIQKDVEKYKDITFNYYILDEAQHIKNPQSKNAKAVKEIKGRCRFALTGTPIENTLTELWSIFDFILPSYLGSYNDFKDKFENPIIKDQEERAYANLTRHVKPFILRRMKGEVLKELPPKIEQVIYADLTREQKKVYLATLGKIRGEIDEELKSNGLQKSHIKILAGLTRLRQICCHPSLFIENYYNDSGKFSLLMEIINERIEGGHRILLFSQFTSMLKIISQSLQEQGICHQYLDGSTDVKERGGIIRDFNAGKGEVFLISLKTGGTGLNLTSADTVIHFDPWWNPAVEEQASDRAYRIGQEKVVHVMKLITKGTIEEKIIALQEKKKLLIDTVIQPGETLITKLTEEEIRDIFDITPN